MLSWSYRIERNPYAVLMRRFAVVSQATLALLCVAIALASVGQRVPPMVLTVAPMVWYLFLSSLMLLLPLMSRSPQRMREFAMLAGISTVATSLDLMLLGLFSLTPFAAMSMGLTAALFAYALARRWLLNPLTEIGLLSAERMFDRLYAMVREVEANPREAARLLGGLLRDLFEPIDMLRIERRSARARVVGDGSALLVPLPLRRRRADRPALLLRFAGRGQRIFTRDDARLTDRVVEQLRRAVAYDQAVERGRSEERMRIAQDLHDDIGARLLTLMYKAQTPEIEDYIRHTLKDLKTLTRGLAATEHRLSHAGAEWKADITQRLSAAQIELSWNFDFDQDLALSVVQWSALTRVLRELVSNTIQHSCATRVEISAALSGGDLRLLVCDDGIGRSPQAWSHGLGLGGVRKRVKLLGGDVRWRDNEGGVGIACVVFIPALASRR